MIASLYWHKAGYTSKLALSVGWRVYLKKEVAAQLERPYYSRSKPARQIVDLLIGLLPMCHFGISGTLFIGVYYRWPISIAKNKTS